LDGRLNQALQLFALAAKAAGLTSLDHLAVKVVVAPLRPTKMEPAAELILAVVEVVVHLQEAEPDLEDQAAQA
jgi:hypothetical protein